MSYRSVPVSTDRMPPGIPFIVGNEAAERFSFYGMRTILTIFMVKYLWLMDSHPGVAMSQAEATEHFHDFVKWAYVTPVFGALLSDIFLGKYRTILYLSLFYCLGHAALACMGIFGGSPLWLASGLILICFGAGGIKPCVSAHVGDQFSHRNHHLLTRIYNWFYFSINFGSFFSTLLTPWLLEHYGPHWAFGVPGVLMAFATLLFWLGRHRFVHVPPGGWAFVRETFSRDGVFAVLKLVPLFIFIAMFWALYDQTGSSWIFQAEQMDRQFLGIHWLESQIQAANPILILTLIPLSTFVIYPALGRIFNLTPLRKIGIGLFLIAASFGLTTLIQTWIDGGAKPSIGWQLLAYILITTAEVMVSIVGLEFAYTQAPRKMKSVIMALYLLSVALGNALTSEINHFIQIPSAAMKQLAEAVAQLPPNWQDQPRNVVLGGYDGQTGTPDDFVQHLENGSPTSLEIPGRAAYDAAADQIIAAIKANDGKLPDPKNARLTLGNDPWGNPIRYQVVDSGHFRLISDGPERRPGTMWEQGLVVTLGKAAEPGDGTSWLERRKRQLGVAPEEAKPASFTRDAFSGGQTKLEGAGYFRFFTWLMLGTAVLFVPFAALYRQKTYLQHGGDEDTDMHLPPSPNP